MRGAGRQSSCPRRDTPRPALPETALQVAESIGHHDSRNSGEPVVVTDRCHLVFLAAFAFLASMVDALAPLVLQPHHRFLIDDQRLDELMRHTGPWDVDAYRQHARRAPLQIEDVL
jgi:hypothetical protein